jgi:Chaperone of endosialidase
MKSLLNILFVLGISVQIFAQTPNFFNFQGVARDAAGKPIVGAVSLKIAITNAASGGAVLYEELHDPVTTDANGLFSIQIGKGSTLNNTTWAGIIWWIGDKYVQVSMRTPSSGVYELLGTPKQLASVPFAQDAKSLDLPFYRRINANNVGFVIENDGGWGFQGITNAANKAGIVGNGKVASTVGVYGDQIGGDGYAIKGDVIGANSTSVGVQGQHLSAGTWGRLGTKDFAGHFNGEIKIDNGSVNITRGNLNVSNTIETSIINVRGTVNYPDVITYRYLSKGSVGTSTENPPYSIYAASRVLASEFNAYSDKRIKNIVGISKKDNDLSILKKLKVTDYKYIDLIEHGDKIKKGFIAQEVAEVFPEAVTKQKDFIPNIFSMSTSNSVDIVNSTLTIQLDKTPDIIKGDKIRIVTDKQAEYIVASVVGNTISIENFKDENPKNVFVYGKEVNDFHTIDYDRLYTLNVSATQELASKVQKLEEQNAILNLMNKSINEKLQQMEAKLDRYSASLDQTNSSTLTSNK